MHLWRLQINMSSFLPKLFDMVHNLGEWGAEGGVAVPTYAQELLYAWIGET